MIRNILLNSHDFVFGKQHLPCLIHGEEKTGASLFTMTLIAKFYQQGHSLLCLTGFPMAKDEFLSETQAVDDTLFLTNRNYNQSELAKKAIFITKENHQRFMELVRHLSDINERIILLKNIDLLDKEVFWSS